MQVLMADESGYAGGGYFAMAGYIANHDTWPVFDRLWNRALDVHGVDHFHMKDYAHRKGIFKDWDEAQRVALMTDLLEIITAGPLFALGACLRVADFEKLAPEVRERMVGPYMACWHEMILGVGLTGATGGYPLSGIDVVYSEQDEFRRHMKGLWEFSKGYRDYGPALGVLEFRNMRRVPGLQAADLLVYEFRHRYHLRDTRPDLGLRHPWRTMLAHQEELHAKRLKFLPGWLLEMQGNGLVEPGMHIVSTDPQWHHMYQQINPGFTDLKRDQALMRLLDRYVPLDPEKAFGLKL